MRRTYGASIRALVVAGALVAATGSAQQSDGDTADMLPLGTRPTLLGGPNSPEEWLRDHGLGFDVSWIEYGQALVSPTDGDNELLWGGKLNARLNLDLSRLGLWKGLSAHALTEYNTGNDGSPNGAGGVLLPVNTQMYHPAGTSSALSLTITQRFGKAVALTVGKFNMVDAASATPLVGGGGVNTFWNLAFAAPPSGLVPAYITGLSLGVKTAPSNVTLMVYDPRDSQDSSGLDGWGKDGINVRLSAQIPARLGGRDGSFTAVGIWSNQERVDLGDLAGIALPPSSGATVDTLDESWYLGFTFQQYLWQNPADGAEGWGLFGQAFLADGNPNLYRWFFNLGLGGTSPIPGRHLDRAGVGVFVLSPSGDLTDSLESIYGITVGQERGVEAFYNAAVVPWFRVALDVQYIRPGVRGNDNAFFAGLSAQLKL